MFLAGHVTTVNLIGNGVVALLTHPDQLAKLKANTELAKGVVEETLRYWGPIDFIGRRIAKEDVEVGGYGDPDGRAGDGQPRGGQPGSRRGSQTPTSSILPVPMPTGTSPLERASTSASGRHWHGSRVRSRSARCFGGSRSCDWQSPPRSCGGVPASCAGSRACQSCSRPRAGRSSNHASCSVGQAWRVNSCRSGVVAQATETSMRRHLPFSTATTRSSPRESPKRCSRARRKLPGL